MNELRQLQESHTLGSVPGSRVGRFRRGDLGGRLGAILGHSPQLFGDFVVLASRRDLLAKAGVRQKTLGYGRIIGGGMEGHPRLMGRATGTRLDQGQPQSAGLGG